MAHRRGERSFKTTIAVHFLAGIEPTLMTSDGLLVSQPSLNTARTDYKPRTTIRNKQTHAKTIMKNGQSQRIWAQISIHKNKEFSLPALVAIAANGGAYVTSISKRISECRARANSRGWRFEKTKDVHENGIRKTAYTLKTK